MAKIILLSADLEKRFELMKKLPRTAVIQTGFVDAADHIADMVDAEAPTGDTGNLRAGIVAGGLKSKTTAGSFVASRARHSAIINFGTVERSRKSGGRTGRVTANPFFNRGITRGQKLASEIIFDAIEKELKSAASS